MIGILPKSLDVGGQYCKINSDYRVILNLFEVLQSSELTDLEKAYISVKSIYVDEIPDRLFTEAVKKAYWFCDGGDMPKSEPAKVRLIDYKHDEGIIFPAINKAAGCEVRAVPYMHWWTFIGLVMEIRESVVSTVLNLRQKKNRGKKLEKHEKEFWDENKGICVLKARLTDEEKAEKDALEKALG